MHSISTLHKSDFTHLERQKARSREGFKFLQQNKTKKPHKKSAHPDKKDLEKMHS